MSHVWGNIVGKVAFVTLWTMILTGVSGAKETIWEDIYSHKCISVSSKGIIPTYLQIPLANPTREWCYIGDRVSASVAAGHAPVLAVTLTWVKCAVHFLHFASVPMSNCWHRWRKRQLKCICQVILPTWFLSSFIMDDYWAFWWDMIIFTH